MRGLKIHFLLTDVLFSTEQIKQNNLCSCTLNDKFRALWDGARFTRPVLCWFAKEAQSWFALQRHLSINWGTAGPVSQNSLNRNNMLGITDNKQPVFSKLQSVLFMWWSQNDYSTCRSMNYPRLMMTNYSGHVGYTSYSITNDCLKIHGDNAIKQCFSYGRLQVARKIILNTNHKMQLTI